MLVGCNQNQVDPTTESPKTYLSEGNITEGMEPGGNNNILSSTFADRNHSAESVTNLLKKDYTLEENPYIQYKYTSESRHNLQDPDNPTYSIVFDTVIMTRTYNSENYKVNYRFPGMSEEQQNTNYFGDRGTNKTYVQDESNWVLFSTEKSFFNQTFSIDVSYRNYINTILDSEPNPNWEYNSSINGYTATLFVRNYVTAPYYWVHPIVKINNGRVSYFSYEISKDEGFLLGQSTYKYTYEFAFSKLVPACPANLPE